MATVDVRDFAGADGSLTSGIQEAINALPSVGGTVEIPAGTFPLTTTIKTPTTKPVRIVGEGEATLLTMAAAYKDLNFIELRGDGSSVSNLALQGVGQVVGKGRGIQIGRLSADDTGQVGRRFRVSRVKFTDIPNYTVAFYGTNVTQEMNEGNPNTAVGARSLCIQSLVEDCYAGWASAPQHGGMYGGSGCTTLSFRDNLVGVPAGTGGPAIKLYGVTTAVLDRCVMEGIDGNYLQIINCADVVAVAPYFEQDSLVVPASYFVDVQNSFGTTLYAPMFIRHTGTTGVCLFASFDANCQASAIINAQAIMGVNSAGTSIAKNGSPLTLVGPGAGGTGKIQQPSGYADMTVT